MTLALAEVFHLGNARSTEAVLRPSRAAANLYAIAAVAVSVGLQILAVRVPLLRDVLRLADLDASEWAVIVIASAIPALVGQAIKLARSVRVSQRR
jgi:Ca2+-transporting ATPase